MCEKMPTGLFRRSWTAGVVASATALGLGVATLPTLAIARVAAPEAAPEAAPTAAEVTPIRAAILPLAVEGDEMPTADRDQLTGRLVEGLRRGDFDVIAPDEVLRQAPNAATCRDAACYTAIARTTGASHVVRAVVQAEDRDYQVEVVLVDGKDGAQVASAADSCQICGVAEVADLLDAAAATLRTKLDNLAQGPATLVVASNPAGARVSIDGELKGTTPFNAPVLAGKHVLRISLEGYITVEREVTFVEGIEETQSFELEKVPSRLPGRPWGWVSLGVGLAGVGTGVAFAVLDDRPYRLDCDRPDAQGDCPQLWDVEWYAVGAAVVGAGLATLGVAILLNSAKRRTKKSAVDTGKKGATAATGSRRPRFGIGLGSVSIRGRF
jgi:PEGA domain